MKQKRIFKRQRERHPFRWFAITVGLLFLSFASFGAGVQFATLTLDSSDLKMADTAKGSSLEAGTKRPLRTSGTPGRDT